MIKKKTDKSKIKSITSQDYVGFGFYTLLLIFLPMRRFLFFSKN